MSENLPCGKNECVFKCIQGMIDRMKEEVAARQNIQYPEQIVVAGIYNFAASTLAEACRRESRTELTKCVESENHMEAKISIDTFILLKQLKDENLLTPEYEERLFKSLLEIEPSIKEQVEKDRKLGIL